MDIQLTSEQAEIVQSKVASGQFRSASEVVSEALRLMSEQDEFLALQKEDIIRKLEEAQASLRAGRGIDGEGAFRMLDEHRQRYKQERR